MTAVPACLVHACAQLVWLDFVGVVPLVWSMLQVTRGAAIAPRSIPTLGTSRATIANGRITLERRSSRWTCDHRETCLLTCSKTLPSVTSVSVAVWAHSWRSGLFTPPPPSHRKQGDHSMPRLLVYLPHPSKLAVCSKGRAERGKTACQSHHGLVPLLLAFTRRTDTRAVHWL